MLFTYNGRKTKGYESIASGCSLLIAIAAIIGIASVNDLSDLSENSTELVILACITGMLIFSLFKKKGKTHQQFIKIENNSLLIDQYKISFKDIHFDTYTTSENEFSRYHIWDTKGICSFYSVFDDDLSKHLKSSEVEQNKFKENSSKHSDQHITIHTENRKLYYNLESGFYKITEEKTIINEITPSIYCFDGKFTLAIQSSQ